MALENSPVEARGLMSGILQQGYSFGYVLAACTNYGVGGEPDSWKWVFWVGAGFSIAVGLIRIFFPESPQFIEAKKVGANKANVGAFFKEVKIMMKQEWRLAIYCIILMTWFNCESSPFFHSLRTKLTDSKSQSTATPHRTPTPLSCSQRSKWTTPELAVLAFS